ncbi:alpha/beta-hydrolase [Hypoxylon fuscum]|nr:alpha/beta-hydrolase [Hypoxylon fuscum]
MASVSDLAVVICHGSYHTPAPYLPLLNVGDVNKPDFDRGPPEGGYPQGNEDAKVILDVLEPLVNDQKKKVLVVAHSSGGWVATETARPELQAKARKDKGLAGGIIGILYMGAFIVPVGESIHSFFQPKDGTFMIPPFLKFHKPGAAGLATPSEAETYFFNDLATDVGKKWATTLTASPILTTKLSNDAYAALPCAYLVLESDLTLPKEYQEVMIASQAQKTGEFTVYRCATSHSPHLSWTQGVVDTVQDFVKKIEG